MALMNKARQRARAQPRDHLGLTPPGVRESEWSLRAMLGRRGLEPFRLVGRRSVIKPRDPSLVEAYYQRLKRYSFRLVLRDLIARPGTEPDRLTRFCSPATIKSHLAFLSSVGLIAPWEHGHRLLVSPVRSFGETLEWFVARLLHEEFSCETLWGVRAKGREPGGDYDVLARIEHELVYVEMTASPPKHITPQDVGAFLGRIGHVAPHMAVYFVDTELRMTDKLAPLFEAELRKRHGARSRARFPVTRLHAELYHVNHRVFLINSKRSLGSNFRTCFRDYWANLIGI
jgi:hypothetical protein